MRVGLDAHMVGERETGNETYALGLLHGFDQIGFAVDAYSFSPLPVRYHRRHGIWPHLSALRIPVSLPIVAWRDRLDLLHTTYTLPPLLPCPAVVAVHDITFDLHPEWFSPPVRAMLSVLVPRALHQAARVVTISQRTKCDIVERFGIDPDKIAVTYLAARPALATPVSGGDAAEPFFLYVGNVQPRKNVGTLIRAMHLLRQRHIEIPLVVAGKPGLGYSQVARLVGELGLDPLVHFTGYVPDDAIRALLAGCTALLHPALYEGFGLTPLEAMTHGRPVVAANAASLPEVVGDAGILVPPLDVEAWAEGMAALAGDAALRAALGCRGRLRAQQFSWVRCARETLAVYRAIVDSPRLASPRRGSVDCPDSPRGDPPP